jgi:ribonuclease BN (tRNA processing enzyme)
MVNTRRRFAHNLLQIAGAAAALPLVRPASAQTRGASAGGAPRHGSERLVLLGTQGGPNFTPERSESSSALVIDSATYLVDCGYGTLGSLIAAELNYLEVGNIFLTHLHDDHTSDLAALLSHQWTSGRIEPTLVHGPHGTKTLVDAAVAFGAANAAIRLIDEARSVQPESLFSGVDIDPEGAAREVFRDDRVCVSAVENTHYPHEARARMRHRSLAYRFDTPFRSVVFSGDTAYSPALVSLAQDADILICEAMDVDAMRRAFDAKVAAGAYADNPEGIWRHIAGTHTSTEEAGRMAEEAGVKLLVLNHVLPGAMGDLSDEAYIEGVREAFSGDVVVGRDFMEL